MAGQKRLFAAYTAAKREQSVLDYDELLLYWYKMLRKPDIAKVLRNRFPYILVDEFQYTNRLQSKILRRLKPDGLGVTVVGDDAQAIYSFRAATVKNILGFPSQYDPAARVIKLEQNYRSTDQILKACNATIKPTLRSSGRSDQIMKSPNLSRSMTMRHRENILRTRSF
jgi:DNA helicase-2/ATP-dependent DNA helicase PcrA